MTRASLALLMLGLGGCAFNGILEVEMQLPYESGDPSFAVVEVGRQMPGSWHDRLGEPVTFALDGPETDLCDDSDRRCNVRFSVNSQDGGIEALYLKISFCREADCLSFPDDSHPPIFAYVLERPIYIECRSRWYAGQDPFPRPELEMQPEDLPSITVEPTVRTVPRCEIGNADQGDELTGDSYCLMDGRHFCEVPLRM